MTRDAIAPSAWVERWARLIRPGEVLDLACGRGRHARLLASLGHRVLALDRDAEALSLLQGVPNVRTLCTELEGGAPWPLEGREFAAVVVTNYLYRPLYPRILAALGREAVLIYETFAQGNARFGRPSNPAFLLKPGELLQVFGAELTVVAFEQGVVAQPRPAVVQRLCALRAGLSVVQLEP